MTERDIRERDILVASNEYAYVQDLTKGDIVLYVGPTKISLSNTERIVDLRDGRFVPVRSEEGLGVSPFVTATSSQYVVLENPLKDPTMRPVKGNNGAVELLSGRKVVVPGPATFPLWPGQRARVVSGHALREDEYLIVRVYEPTDADAAPIGTEQLVRGTDTSFYVPRTGLEVVEAPHGGYVRKAHRLRMGMGLHLRVIKASRLGSDGNASRLASEEIGFAAREGDAGSTRSYAAGEELFLVDRDGFFFPTEHVEVVGEVSAVPLAEGEGLYVRDLETGRVRTVLGPVSYLPDPTKVAVMYRALDVATERLYGVSGRDPSRAVAIYVPSGFAILVVSADRREVVRGPVTRVLGYDEHLETLELSTGKPKSSATTLRTSFLQVDGNKVSDLVRLRTKDHIEIEVAVSYRVSFVTRTAPPNGESSKETPGSGSDDASRWFSVTDYVGLMCDHLGSLLRAAARAVTLDRFHAQSTELLRGAVLGDKSEGPRPGRHFDENGMWIYDVEILEVHILDEQVKDLIESAQRSAIVSEITRQNETQRLESERLREEVNRGVLAARRETLEAATAHEMAERTLLAAKAESEVAVDRAKRVGTAMSEAEALTIRSSAQVEAQLRDAGLEEKRLRAKVDAFREEMAALAPELITTLKTLGNQRLTEELTKHAAPLAILGGTSVTDVVERLLGNLPIGTTETVRTMLAEKPRDRRSDGETKRG